MCCLCLENCNKLCYGRRRCLNWARSGFESLRNRSPTFPRNPCLYDNVILVYDIVDKECGGGDTNMVAIQIHSISNLEALLSLNARFLGGKDAVLLRKPCHAPRGLPDNLTEPGKSTGLSRQSNGACVDKGFISLGVYTTHLGAHADCLVLKRHQARGYLLQVVAREISYAWVRPASLKVQPA
jgi:hypothetical protein